MQKARNMMQSYRKCPFGMEKGNRRPEVGTYLFWNLQSDWSCKPPVESAQEMEYNGNEPA